jgi:threonylcarbamoyladenosine tRNA methylthiotransferase MtaB
LNFAESSSIGRQFLQNGFEVSSSDEHADIHIVNTCSVSHRADRECRQLIRHIHRNSPNAYIIVAGCYTQLQPEEVASIEGVDLVLGTNEKFKIFDFANHFQKNDYPKIFVSEIKKVDDFGIAYSGDADGRTRAFLKVQDGCDFKCTYCTIPLARGISRSLPIDSIIPQARMLAEKGYKEVVLSGVNVGDYGKKIDTDLLSLLRSLGKVDGIERIRVSSIEPNLLTKPLIDYMLGDEKFCNHFHIPLQSGSNEILKSMSRRYTTEDYHQLIEYIQSKDSSAGIGADVIVGFPGETEAEFDETYGFLVDLPVSYLHVFTYSERPFTPAATSSGRVEPAVRHDRNERLRMLGEKKKHYFNSKFIGRTLPVLYETQDEGGNVAGFTSNYIRVKVKTEEILTNQIVPTLIEQVFEDHCEGVVIDNSLRNETIQYSTITV